MNPPFCSPWDEALARGGPPSVFLPDREGLFRFDADWTRDCWGRSPGPHAGGWAWLLVRDHDTGFVNLILATSPTLIAEHPRAEVRAHDTAEAAYAAWRAPW